jgi:hypothetical protein
MLTGHDGFNVLDFLDPTCMGRVGYSYGSGRYITGFFQIFCLDHLFEIGSGVAVQSS